MPPPPRRPHVFSAEMLGWMVCVSVAMFALLNSWSADFPARSRSLAAEALGLGFSLLAAWVAAGRRHATPTTTALASVRLVLGVPTMLFWLMIARAGFAA